MISSKCGAGVWRDNVYVCALPRPCCLATVLRWLAQLFIAYDWNKAYHLFHIFSLCFEVVNMSSSSVFLDMDSMTDRLVVCSAVLAAGLVLVFLPLFLAGVFWVISAAIGVAVGLAFCVPVIKWLREFRSSADEHDEFDWIAG